MTFPETHRNRFTRTLKTEEIETRILLTSNGFTAHEVFSTDHLRPIATVLADLDADGDLDIVSASAGDRKIAWYENIDDEGTFGEQKVIDASKGIPSSLVVSDLNGDDKLDVIAAAVFGEAGISWYPQSSEAGRFDDVQGVSSPDSRFDTIVAADLDGDGDADILAGRHRQLSWFENTDGLGTFGDERLMSSVVKCPSFNVGDVDRDGDLDVFAGSGCNNNNVHLFRNDGGGKFLMDPIIVGESHSTAIFAADVDGDADLDLVTNYEWFENSEGALQQPQRWAGPWSSDYILPVDMDRDGDIDILKGSEYEHYVGWHENIDGHGNFADSRSITLFTNMIRALAAGDIDGDGDPDVVSASEVSGSIAWHENTDSMGNFGDVQEVSKTASEALSAIPADLDGDGDLDVLSVSMHDGKIAWYANEDGRGDFGEQVLIDQELGGAFGVEASDVDGDGDLDVVASFFTQFDEQDEDGTLLPMESFMRWYENADGLGSFSANKPIDDPFPDNAARTLRIDDFDGDKAAEVIAFHWDGASLYDYSQETNSFGLPQQVLSTPPFLGTTVNVDFDNDGDTDILARTQALRDWRNEDIVWLVNSGDGSFEPHRLLRNEGLYTESLHTADIDGDGDKDILTIALKDHSGWCALSWPPQCDFGERTIGWYENTNGEGR